MLTTDTPKREIETNVHRACPKCAANQQGRMSCCYKGGSWFPRCGPSGAYTWAKGLHACRSVAFGAKALAQAQTNSPQIAAQLQSTDFADAEQSSYNVVSCAVVFAAIWMWI